MRITNPSRPPSTSRLALRRFLDARRRVLFTDTDVDGLRLTTRRIPSARPQARGAVLLPGLGLSGRYLLPLAAQLSTRMPVWAPDLPGFGRSGRPDRVLDVPALGRVVARWLDEVGLEQVCLFGNSMGGQVAVEAAICAPARVSHLVLEAPTMDAGARRVAPHVWRVAVDATREPVSLGPLQVADWSRAGPRRLARTTRHAFEHAIESRLPLVACPTLVVRGGRDPIVPQRWAETVAAAGATATLHTVDVGSHAMPYSRPVLLASVIAEFVSRP